MNPAKERFRMAEKREEVLDMLEKMKEIQRMEFDYFKHLTTLSAGSILILVAFLEKVFSNPIGKAWVVVSVCCFVLCLISSLRALPSAANIVLYTTGIRMVLISGGEDVKKAEAKVKEGLKKINKALGLLKIYDRVTGYSFQAGIIAFLIFAGINFFS